MQRFFFRFLVDFIAFNAGLVIVHLLDVDASINIFIISPEIDLIWIWTECSTHRNRTYLSVMDVIQSFQEIFSMNKMGLDLGRLSRLTRDPYPVSTNVRSCQVTSAYHFSDPAHSTVFPVRYK